MSDGLLQNDIHNITKLIDDVKSRVMRAMVAESESMTDQQIIDELRQRGFEWVQGPWMAIGQTELYIDGQLRGVLSISTVSKETPGGIERVARVEFLESI